MDYRDPSLTSQQRAEALLSEMTVEEKVQQLTSIWAYEAESKFAFDPAKAKERMEHGIGQITRLGGCTNLPPVEAARLGNAIQRFLVKQTRLGIPALIHEESCAGYLTRDADVFPQALGVAASFDAEIARQMGVHIREQMMALGAREALAPLMDVTRDPRWGRTEETYGEDPYLVARMGVSYIQGLQGEDMQDGVLATGKHFVGYGASEGGMNWAPTHISAREMEEVYLYPFEAAVREGGLRAIMPAYHENDGIPCHADAALLQGILRDKWGFDGLVVSDYFGVKQIHDTHQVAASPEEAARMALEAGVDAELPTMDCYCEPLVQAVREGKVPESLLDTCVLRVLRVKFALGLFEKPYVDEAQVDSHFRTQAMRSFALESAKKTLTLLKNDGILPLKAPKRIAVIGPNADDIRNMLGDYSYPAHVESLMDQNEDNYADSPTPDSLYDPKAALPEMDSVLQGLRKRFPDAEISYAKGCGVLDGRDTELRQAADAAKHADVAIVVVGDKAGLILDCSSGEARDRTTLTLPGRQRALVQAIRATGTPVVVVLVHGRPFDLTWEDANVQAILSAWLPGEEGAAAIAGAIAGDYSPAGRLPITFPRSAGQIPIFYAHRPSGGRSHWKGAYVDESNLPLYPFGHGLSYTSFAYSDLKLPQAAPVDGAFTVELTVQNTGVCDGDEVVQLYLQDLVAQDVTRPVKELKGFARLSLKAGESKRIRFTVQVAQLAFLNRDMRFVVEPGQLKIMVGASSEDIRLDGTLELTGETLEIRNKVFASACEIL